MRLPLSAYLLRATISPSSALTPKQAGIARHFEWTSHGLQSIDATELQGLLDAARVGDVLLTLLDRPAPPPQWQQLIESAFEPEGFRALAGRSRGAIVSCVVDDPAGTEDDLRWISWTFGTGSQSLRRECVEPRFGLIAAFNRLVQGDAGGDTHGLRQLQYDTYGAFRQRTGHRAARDTPLDGFRMERITDLLAAVGGRVGDEDGSSVFGRRQIKLTAEIDRPKDLHDLAATSIADYRSDSYKEEFGFIDDYVAIEDPNLLSDLRAELYTLLAGRSPLVDVFVPDDLLDFDDERSLEFVLLRGERRATASSRLLTVDQIANLIQQADPSSLEWDLRFCDQPDNVIAHATIADCLTADFTMDGQRYLVADGQFYAVSVDFMDRINQEVAEVAESDLPLPCYLGGTEGAWSSGVVDERPDQFISLDGEMVRVDGTTPFEAADLIHASGALLHVKRKSRSSILSYLFVQARRSSEMLLEDPEARRQMFEHVSRKASTPALADTTLGALGALDLRRPDDLDVVLVILGDWKGRSAVNLPLIAKTELLASTRRIAQLGYRPKLALVDSCAREMTSIDVKTPRT